MGIKRKPVGEPLKYKGYTIQPRFLGPDLICEVNDLEVGQFYPNAESARNAGKRYVDQVIKESRNQS